MSFELRQDEGESATIETMQEVRLSRLVNELVLELDDWGPIIKCLFAEFKVGLVD